MRAIAELIKEFLVPGSTWFLVIGMTFGVVLLLGPSALRRWGTRWLVVLTMMYWFLSVPAVSQTLSSVFSGGEVATSSSSGVTSADAVVVLGNGIRRYKVGDIEIDTLLEESAYTVLESIRLYRQLGSPLMIVSGGISRPDLFKYTEAEVLRNALLEQGVPGARIVMEGRSNTTQEQAVNVKPILRSHNVARFALVTSPTHMPRAVAVFESQSLAPIPAPSAYSATDPYAVHGPWRPTGNARSLSERAIYDLIGRLYYRGRGWSGSSGE